MGAGGGQVIFAGTQNTVDYGIGDGATTINLNGSTGTIVLGAGITESDLIFQSDAAGDLTISLLGAGGTVSSDDITVVDTQSPNSSSQTGQLDFADGSILAINGNLLDTWTASSLTTTLVGSDFAGNLFELAPGGDSVTFGNTSDGGNGANFVDYDIGDGAVSIDANGGTGTIVMGTGITASDVYFQSDAAGDLTIGLLGADGLPTGDSIVTPGAFYGYNSHIPDIQFADGSTLAINAGLTDTWFFGIGDGAVTIAPNGMSNRIAMGAGITASDVYFQSDAAGDLTIGLLGADGMPGGDTIIADGALYPYNNNGWYVGSSIGDIQFADGSSVAITGTLTDMWWGPGGNTTLVGSDWSANQFESLASGDTVVFGNGDADSNSNNYYGGAASGANTVDYDVGDGSVTVNPNGANWNEATIAFGAGITQSDLIFETDNAQPGNLTIALLGAGGALTGDAITIENEFNAGNDIARVGAVDFADGTSISLYQDYSLLNTWYGSVPGTALVGTDYGDNQFEDLQSGDSILFGNGALNNGNAELNTVDYNIGDGAVTVNPNGAWWDGGVLEMGTGITANDVIFETDNAQTGNLTIALLGAGGTLTGDAITIQNEFNQNNVSARVGAVDFADGTSISLYQNPNLLNTWYGNAPDSTLVGTDYGANLFESLQGGDNIVFGNGALNWGNNEFNTVDYNIGDGAVTINPNGAWWDGGVLEMGTGITASDVIFETDNAQTGNLTIALLGAGGTLTGDAITIQNEFNQNNVSARVGAVDFADGTSISLYQNPNLLNTWYGTVSGSTLVGTDYGDNQFEDLQNGDNIVFGNGAFNWGNGEWNVVDYNVGDGAVTVDPNGANWNEATIAFGAGITQSDLIFETDNAQPGNLTIALLGAGGTLTGDAITIENEFNPNNVLARIGYLDFADGTSIQLAQNPSLLNIWYGTTPDSTLVGTDYGANLFESLQSGDNIVFGNGALNSGNNEFNTVDYNIGDGAVTINPNGAWWDGGVLEMGAGISASNLIFETDNQNNGNLTIALLGASGMLTGDAITIQNEFNGGNDIARVGAVDFADGTSISLYQDYSLLNTWYGSVPGSALVGTDYGDNQFEDLQNGDSIVFGNGALNNGNAEFNTVDYDIGDGAVTINPNGYNWGTGTIVMGAGITESDVIFESDNTTNPGDLTIALLGTGGTLTGDSMILQNDLYGYPNNGLVYSVVEQVEFADGTSISLNHNPELVNTWLGSTGTLLEGSDFGDNLFELAPGGDTVVFGNGSLYGDDQNTVDYGIGDGAVTINPNGDQWFQGTIVLGAGITENDVIFQSDAAGDLTIALLGSGGTLTGDGMTILGDFGDNGNDNVISHIGPIVFADGTTINASQSLLLNTWIGSPTDTTLVGSEYGPNLFELAPGGGTVTFGTSGLGGGGENTVEFGYGDGEVTIDTNGGDGGIELGAGISASNVALQLNPDDSLDIELLSSNGSPTGDVLSISSIYDVSYIDLAEGTSLNIAGNLTIFGTSGDDTIAAWASGDTIVSGPGNDFLQGSSGSNTFVYNVGYGDDYVDAYSMGNSGSTILMGPGITESDITFSRGGGGPNQDLIVSVAGAGIIQIGAELSQRPISAVDFSDGTSISLAGNLTYSATAVGQTVTAWESGDTLVDDFGNGTLQGTSGSNTFDYNFGDGNEYIAAYSIGNAGSDIVMGPGITASDVSLQRGGGGPNQDLIVNVAGSGAIQIGAELSQRPISEIDFSDGTSIDLTGNLVFSADGAGQTVTPWTNGDTLTSGGFANSVLAGSGDAVDYLFGSGDGAMTVANSNATSQLDFGPGISDNQLWFTQSGNDLLINVIGSQDQVDVQSWFSGGQNAQLAEINDSGGNAIDSGLNQLIAAMATFDANNPGFNPETATQMPNDSNLQAAIAAAWHQQAA
jgi:hypothetical protein